MLRSKKLKVQNISVSLIKREQEDYICISDMASAKSDKSRSADVVKNWMRNRRTIEFLGVWEKIYNPNFNVVEFDHIRSESGLPTFVLSPSAWIEKTNAVGIYTKLGKFGGTYAHKDIAFEFGSYISPEFKLYLIEDYQRLKEIETNQYNLEWNVNRILNKANYSLQTKAVQDHIIPFSQRRKSLLYTHYSDEADMLNDCVLGMKKRDWAKMYPDLAKKGLNPRENASINENLVMSRLEVINSEMIKSHIGQEERFKYLQKTAQEMLADLDSQDVIKSLKKQSDTTFIDAQRSLSDHNKKLKQGLGYNPKEEE